jgi:hypothetical protein
MGTHSRLFEKRARGVTKSGTADLDAVLCPGLRPDLPQGVTVFQTAAFSCVPRFFVRAVNYWFWQVSEVANFANMSFAGYQWLSWGEERMKTWLVWMGWASIFGTLQFLTQLSDLPSPTSAPQAQAILMVVGVRLLGSLIGAWIVASVLLGIVTAYRRIKASLRKA